MNNYVRKVPELNLSGDLRGRPVALVLRGELRDQQWQLQKFDLSSGPSRLEAKGQLGQAIALNWTVKSPDLATLVPDAGGSLIGSGKVTGKLPRPAVQVDLNGENLHWTNYRLGELSLVADVDLNRPQPSSLALRFADGRLGELVLDTLTLDGEGTAADHTLALNAQANLGRASLSLDGELGQERWLINFTDGLLQYDNLGAWSLAEPQQASIAAHTQTLTPGCWRSAQASLCLQGEQRSQALSAAMEISQLPLAYFGPLLPEQLLVAGMIAGKANVTQAPGEALTAALDFNLGASILDKAATANSERETLVSLQPGRLTAQLSEAGATAEVDLPMQSSPGLQARVTLPGGSAPWSERALSGELELGIDDLSFLAALSPELTLAAGQLQGQMQVAGSLDKPQPQGELLLSDGRLQLQTPGLDIKHIEMKLKALDGERLSYQLQATSGAAAATKTAAAKAGTLALEGTARLGDDGITAGMTLRGDSFKVANSRDARAWMSPDLKLTLGENGIAVGGPVTVPTARITPKELPASAVSVSEDQVIIRAESDTAVAAAGPPVRAQVQVIMGDSVKVNGFGFKGGVTGKLAVTQRPGEPTVGKGQLNIVDGEYRAYGQGLVIEDGRILFPGGPIDKPGLNLRAVRRPAENVTVGVRVRGSLEKPDFTVFSEPSMTQSEQLSWLVLGRPLAGASDAEGDMMSQAALALGLKGGNYLADRIGENLGVDSFGIETGSGEAGAASDNNQAAFVIGKYLSPKLYLSYGIGLFDAISTVRLQYTINEHWKVSTESSTLSSGGDVIYTIER